MPLRDEILAQPAAITRLLKKQTTRIREIASEVGIPGSIFITARGSSDNAALYAKYIWGANNGIPIALAAPSLFSIYDRPPALKGNLVVGISQSGESPDLIAVLEEANKQGCATLAITNQKDSPLGKIAQYLIDIDAGPELSVAATKSYTSQLAAIAMLSAAWKCSPSLWDQLEAVPGLLEEALTLEDQIQVYSNRYRYMEQCVVLGRGYNYATAYEWSLKLKELTYVGAQPYSSADFLHGPIAMVSSGFPVFAVAPEGAVFSDMKGILMRLKREHLAELLLVSDNQELLGSADCPLQLLHEIPEWLTPLVYIVPAQLFSYHLTLVKGIDPDAPRGLTKVTLTK
jgi:glucosamine--fructose-6-phosphate aminotransferase (isomerizing)